MQKLRIMNDLHLEFGKITVPKLKDDANTILILAGDVHIGHDATDFLTTMLDQFQDVVYILGNHEFYYQDMEEVRKWWQVAQRYKSNLHVLDPGTFEFYDRKGNEYRIIGATLWTETQNPAMHNMLNDYAVIRREHRVLTVQDTYNLYLDDLEYIQAQLATPFEGTTIVVTHHAPVAECVRPQYVGNPMNACFHNYLEDVLKDNDITMWIHGHMHDTVHFTQYETEVYCNPRGYVGHGMNEEFVDDKIVRV